MYSPIFEDKKNTQVYGLVWLSVAIIQANFLVWVLDINILPSVLDAILYCLIFFLISRAIWSVVVVSRFDKINYFNSLLTHLMAAMILITIWYFLGSQIIALSGLVIDLNTYKATMESSGYFRIFQGIFFYLLTILYFYMVVMGEERKEADLREAKLVNHIRQAELEMLKSQLNPHFIFNSLNSISALTIFDPKNAQKMIVLLSEFLRYSLRSTNELVSFKEELEATQKYLAIEKVRFENKLEVELLIPEKISDKMLPSLILQPLVENAIKYGVHESLEKSVLRIEAVVENLWLTIKVSNEYEKTAKTKKGVGVGLKNVSDRLRTIYKLDNLLQINQKDGIFEVTIKFPDAKSISELA